MIELDKGLHEYLRTRADLAKAVSSDGPIRIYPLTAPQETELPMVIFRRSSTDPVQSMDGESGHVTASFTFLVIGLRFKEVKDISQMLFDALSGYRGYMGDCAVSRCLLAEHFDEHFEPQGGDEVGYYQSTMTFTFAYTQTVPSL